MPSKPNSKILEFKPHPSKLLVLVRSAALDTRNVAFSSHARQRLELRDISDLEAIKVLRLGEIKGDIEPGGNRGEWKCKIVAPIKGRRDVGVITIILVNGRLLIKTVEWEDL